jgi:type IX secretion system PorP/SprF family membrane protein
MDLRTKSFLLFLFLLPIKLLSQELFSSHSYYVAPLFLNPSLTENKQKNRLIYNYRNQWPNSRAIATTQYVSFEHTFKNGKRTLAGSYFYNNYSQKTFSTRYTGLIYSRKFIIKQKYYLNWAFEAAYFVRKIDWSRLSFGSMIDPRYGFIYGTNETLGPNSVGNVNFCSGINFNNKNYIIGVSVRNLTQPDAGFLSPDSKINRLYSIHGFYTFSFIDSSMFKITPGFIYNREFGDNQYNLLSYFYFRKLFCGISYRINSMLSLAVGTEFDRFRIMYNYDYYFSGINKITGGAHQFSSVFIFGRKNKTHPVTNTEPDN